MYEIAAPLAFRLRPRSSLSGRPAWQPGHSRLRMWTRGAGIIEAYVMFIYYVGGMYEVAMNPASDRYPEGATVPLEDR